MRVQNLPVERPEPDGARFMDILQGNVHGARTPLVEYLVDEGVMRPIVTELLGRTWVEAGADRASQRAYLDNFIAFWHRMGYDFVRFERSLGFDVNRLLAQDTAAGSARSPARPRKSCSGQPRRLQPCHRSPAGRWQALPSAHRGP